MKAPTKAKSAGNTARQRKASIVVPPEVAIQQMQAAFGANLRQSRLQLKWSQSDLAEKAGTPRPHIASIEGGHINLTIATMVRLACAVHVTVADLLRYPDEQPATC